MPTFFLSSYLEQIKPSLPLLKASLCNSILVLPQAETDTEAQVYKDAEEFRCPQLTEAEAKCTFI